MQHAARQRDLTTIVTKRLNNHMKNGLLKIYTDNQLESFSHDDVKQKLIALGEYDDSFSEQNALDHLRTINRQVHLKIWHDHGKVSGHSNMLCTVEIMFDPSMYVPEAQ